MITFTTIMLALGQLSSQEEKKEAERVVLSSLSHNQFKQSF